MQTPEMQWIEKLFHSEHVAGTGITVKLSMPQISSASDRADFAECAVVLVYHETNSVVSNRICGVDEFQALSLSYLYIRRTLLEHPHKLSSEGVSVEECFPMSINPSLGRFSRALENFVERRSNAFHERRGKRLEARYKRKRK